MTFTDFIKAAVRGTWRRRTIMMMPLIILIPVAFAAALLWPTRYETSALILLQEHNGITGNVPNYMRAQEMKDKVLSLEALVKSEYVLRRTLGRDAPGDLSKRDLDLLRDRITIEQIGNQFVRVSLQGRQAEGLGAELSGLLTILFESLLTSAGNSLDAPTFVVRQRRQDLEQIQRRLGEASTSAQQELLSNIAAQQAALQAAESEAAAADATLADARRALAADFVQTGLDASLADEAPALILNRLEGERQARDTAGNAPGASQIAPLIEAATRLAASVRAADEARRAITSATGQLDNLQKDLTERNALEREAMALRQRTATLEQRLSATGRTADFQLLSAPAQIQVIDTPKDPQQALSSRLRILIAGILAAVFLAGAFGLVAEQLDDRLRGSAMLKSLTGLPVTATFGPGAFRDAPEPAPQQRAPPQPAPA